MSDVWDLNWFGSTKTLDVHIAWLRRKLGDDPGRPDATSTPSAASVSGSRERRGAGDRKPPGPPAGGADVRAAAGDRRARRAARDQPQARGSMPRSGPRRRRRPTSSRRRRPTCSRRADRARAATLARTAADSVRGRILIVERAPAACSSTAPGPLRSARATRADPRSSAALAGRQVQVTAVLEDARPGDPRHGRADHPQRPAGRRRPGDPERRGRATARSAECRARARADRR